VPDSTIPTIGTLFFVNFLSAVLGAAGLFAPVERRWRSWAGRSSRDS
jgi:hypothetical protein